MQLVIHHEILRMRIYLIPRRTHLLLCGEYMYLKPLFEGSGRKDVIVKMEGYQLDDSFSRLYYRVFRIAEYPEQLRESLGKCNILRKTSIYP
jgi:hypothetical protein